MKKNPLGILSGNALKIIAVIAMTFDHFAYIFYPYEMNLRIPGRIAFPIFAFMIAEGFRYTKNRLCYFLMMTGIGVICQAVFYFATGDDMLNIFLTFALAIAFCALLDFSKRILLAKDEPWWKKLLSPLPLFSGIVLMYFVDKVITFDYGFYGVLLPMCATLLHVPRGMEVPFLAKFDSLPFHLLTFAPCLIMLGFVYHPVQHFASLSLLLLLLYSGKRGKWRMKYFFYIYYPVHMVILEGIHLLLSYLSVGV